MSRDNTSVPVISFDAVYKSYKKNVTNDCHQCPVFDAVTHSFSRFDNDDEMTCIFSLESREG